jgi:HK97 gp10 family phage protein
MSFYLKVEGLADVEGWVAEMKRGIVQGLRDRLKQAARLVQTEAQARTHSRRVKAAMTYDVEVQGPGSYKAVVGPLRRPAFFAHFLEFGTTHSRAFPFLEPAAEAKEEDVVSLVGEPFLIAAGGHR